MRVRILFSTTIELIKHVSPTKNQTNYSPYASYLIKMIRLARGRERWISPKTIHKDLFIFFYTTI